MTIRLKFSDGETPPTVPATGRLLRIMTFPSRPDVLLIYVPENGTVRMPEVQPPFDPDAIAAACRQAGIAARVAVSTPGRFKEAMHKAEMLELRQQQHQERADRRQQQREIEISMIAETLASPTSTSAAKQRVELVAQIHAVEDKIRVLKEDLVKARARAYQKRVYDPQYRKKEAELAQLGQQKLVLQKKIGAVGRVVKSENSAKWEEEQAQKRMTSDAFMRVAQRLLPQDVLDEIWSEMLVNDEAPTTEIVERT